MDIGTLTREYLDPIGVWVGLIISIPVFWTWIDIVWGKRRRHRRWWETVRDTPGKLPAVLIVDLLPGRDIKPVVRHFMSGHETLKSVPEERIVSIDRQADLTPEDMPKLARDIQDAVGAISRMGADELHVFLAGPLIASAAVGAELANISCKVQLFQNDRASNTYVNFGPLRHPRF